MTESTEKPKDKIKSLAGFGVTMMGVQAISAIAGIVLTRNLLLSDYAFLTIFVVAQGAANILSSGAICLIASAKIGEFWGESGMIWQVLLHGSKIQKYTVIFFVPILCIIAAIQYSKAGASPPLVAALTALYIITVAIDQSGRLQSIVLQFNNQQTYVQLLDLSAASIRALAVILLTYYSALDLVIVLAIYALAGLPKLFFIRRQSEKILGKKTQNRLDSQSATEMNKFVVRHLANDIFLCVQPQLTLLATTQFGTTYTTAALGALSRIGQLFNPVYVAIAAFVVPKFSKRKFELASTFKTIVIVATLPALALLLLAVTTPRTVLAILGENYIGLQKELVIAALGFSLYAWLNLCWQLLLNRGHNRYAWVNIPSAMILGVFSFWLVDKSSLSGALWIQLSMSISIVAPLVLELAHIFKTRVWSMRNEN